MARVDPRDAIGWFAILLWIGLSVYFAGIADSAAFQSVGVVGIAAGVGYFALQRHATPNPFGSLELENVMSARIALATDAGSRALAFTSILAKELVARAESSGEPIHPSVVNLSRVDDAYNASILSSDPIANLELEKKILADRLSANKGVEHTRRKSELFQAVVVVVATLQSGLGAYLIEFLGKRVL